MRILFFGTPEFAKNVLCALAASEYKNDIIGVVTREDKPKDRGHKLMPPPVKVAAEKLGYPVYQPQTLKEESFGETFRTLAPDLCIVVAYGKILPHYVLFEPKFGAINVHGSLLPKYRGAAPFQRAIMAGEKEIGVTIMKMDDGVDTGDMLAKAAVPVMPETTCGDIENELSEKGSALLTDVVRALGTDKYPPEKQDDILSTYAKKIDGEDRIIDFSQSADICSQRIRALSPVPLAVTDIDGVPVKITRAVTADGKSTGEAGTVSELFAKGDGRITVNCGEGRLTILRLVPQGKNEMSAGDFIRGRKINENSILGKGENK